jgi:hypothetical protein
MEQSSCFGKVTLFCISDENLTFMSQSMESLENYLNKLVEDEDIQTVDSDAEADEGANLNDSALVFSKV